MMSWLGRRLMPEPPPPVRPASARIRVYLTVDVEAAEERIKKSIVQPAMSYDIRAFGRFANQSMPLGIERLLDDWESQGHRATFYLEPLGAESFGIEGLSAVCQLLLRRGQDVQLHLHPSQLDAFWHSQGRELRSDSMYAYSRAEQAQLMRRGLDLLERAGVPRASVVSFRAGDFAANNDTWWAMADAGLRISSNFNPGYMHECRMKWPMLPGTLFKAEADIWELPMTVVRQPWGALRHLQLTAISSREMRDALEHAYRTGVTDVTILTHSFELFHIDSGVERQGRPNSLASRRLRWLARWLREQSDRFEVLTVSELGRRLRQGEVAAPALPVPIGAGRWGKTALRYAEQAYQRLQKRRLVS